MGKKGKGRQLILPVALLILAFGIYFGYSIWQAENDLSIKKIREAAAAQAEKEQEAAVFHKESAEQDYKTVGVFISDSHEWYNQTLGWGAIGSVKWDEQKQKAGNINLVLKDIQTDNANLQADFEKISEYSNAIANGIKETQTLLKMHRYFHDLDIEFNGYKKTKDYYNITEYKASVND
ncbi:MAG TPA: hypothetical protein DCR24_15755 [Bacillus bacterium]|nr:hypothetical protein [Bacillus sp. (in: firmicutes)]